MKTETERIKLKPFELTPENINDFRIAGFERKVYELHSKKIAEAILNNQLYDTIITVLKEDSHYEIIDGQHRFLNIRELIKDGKLLKYDVFLRIIEAGNTNPRDIYLKLDSGRTLSARDILKSFDDGTIPFFNRLKMFCTHYKSDYKISFFDVLAGINYAKTQIPSLSRYNLREVFEDVSNEDVSLCLYAIQNLYSVFGEKYIGHNIFRSILFRNIIRVLKENPALITQQKKFQTFIQSVGNNALLSKISNERSSENYSDVYDYEIKILKGLE